MQLESASALDSRAAIVHLKCDKETPKLTLENKDVRALRLVRFKVTSTSEGPESSQVFQFLRKAYGASEQDSIARSTSVFMN